MQTSWLGGDWLAHSRFPVRNESAVRKEVGMLDVAAVLLAAIQTVAAVVGLLHHRYHVLYPREDHRHESWAQPSAMRSEDDQS
jgi:hypothetical protein